MARKKQREFVGAGLAVDVTVIIELILYPMKYSLNSVPILLKQFLNFYIMETLFMALTETFYKIWEFFLL